jgi:hypothetical protein
MCVCVCVCVSNLKINKFILQSFSWETNRHSFSEELLRFLCNPKVNYYLHNRLLLILFWARQTYPTLSHRVSFRCILMLSRVRGSVTNNNGFWIGWLDLLTSSCTIYINYNQLQQLIINLLPRTRSILVLLSQFSYNFWIQLSVLMCPPFITSGRTEWKSPPPTVPVILCAYSLLRKRV